MNNKEKQRELLLKLRSDLVGVMHVQPYIIYSDKTIEDLLSAQPTTLDALKAVKGFPEHGKRLQGFGQLVVDIFSKTDKVKDISLKISNDTVEVKAVLSAMEAF